MIFVECKPDFILVQTVGGINKKGIIHELKGKGAVCSRLSTQTNCMGLVDDDPDSPQPPYIKKSQLYSHISQHDIKILCDRNHNNFIIVIIPRLENWILRAASVASVDVRDYDLPNDWRELHRTVNSKLDNYETLLNDLMQKYSPMLTALKGALREGQ